MEQLRIGVIGIGGLRGGLKRHWHHPDGRSIVVAGADISDQELDKFKTEYPEAFASKDYNELLAREDVDAVAVLTPDFCHEEHTTAAFKAGKHVFCEKPLAITVEECDSILQSWKDSGKKFMVGFNMRYMNMCKTMKEIVDSGVIGEVRAVWVRHFVGFGGDYYYHDWHANRENTNSLLLQKGSHDIDIIHWITGKYSKKVSAFGSLDYYGGDKPDDLTCPECAEKESCPEYDRVFKWLDKCAFRQEVDVEDNNVMIMELEDGIKASYLQCHFTPDYQRNYTFIGTEGRLENITDQEGSRVIVKTRQSNTWRELSDRTYHVKEAKGGHGGADPLICKDFVEMILDDKEPGATPIAGRMSVAAGCAGTESLRSGGGVVAVKKLPSFLK